VRSLAVGGTEIWYVDRGTGLPLVLVHGFPLDHTMWTEQIDALAGPNQDPSLGPTLSPATALRVLAPDLRGFGRSRLGTAVGGKVTMDQFADDLAAWLDSLAIREPVVLCGLSMGGYIAFQFWRKFAPRLRGLILCDTKASADTPEGAAGRRDMAERVLREGPALLAETMLPKLLAETTRQQRPYLVEQLQSVIAAGDPQGIAAAARGMAERPDMTAALGQIRCPTLVIVGQQDVISPPAEMRGLAEAIPGAKFVEIPAAGHMSPLENPVAVSMAMRAFLATV
jgi:pimeloyl-ACP methyl ester carboxylesterase